MRRLPCLLGLAAGLMLSVLHAADDHVGVCTHFDQGWSVPEIMPMVADLGVGWIRDGVSWSDIEPEKGHYRIPAKTAAWLDAAQAHHLKVLLLLGYGNKIYADPFSPPAYARAAAFLARHLAGRIDAIEVLNEPNNPDFGSTYGGKWNGKEDDGSVSPYVRAYANVLTVAVAAVKKANPRMLVVGYGAPAPATFRMIALGPPPLLDGITDHPYSGGRKLPEFIPYAATPDLLQRDGIATADEQGTYRSQCAMFRVQEAKYGLHAALWNTEWGYSTALPPNDKENEVVTPEEQAVYVLRRLLEARALGVISFYYLFRDDGGDSHQAWQNFGLVDTHLKPKPAFYAFQRFTAMFAGLNGDDGTAGGFELSEALPDSRCYVYHSTRSPDEWVACWRVAPWPSSSKPGREVSLELPFSDKSVRAIETVLGDGVDRPLEIRTHPKGRRYCIPDYSATPVVIHFFKSS
jgi:hypothetical protein